MVKQQFEKCGTVKTNRVINYWTEKKKRDRNSKQENDGSNNFSMSLNCIYECQTGNIFQ